uniref:Endonuclease 8-like 3 n=1 Tax=Sinocyclocheilus rhinocerous TaxID=307959 RepID=A0A673GH94_9TELE
MATDLVCFIPVPGVSEDCEQRVRVMEALDICSPKESERMLCDVLLDQTVLPCVGNIIKNEALFDSGLNPAVKVKQLTSEQIHHVVRMTQDFTLLFYKCRKNGSPLYKHKVYKCPNCGQCSGTVTVCRLGDNSRMTYYCQRCQTGDPSEGNISKLPTGNCLIGWPYQGGTSSNDHVAKQQEEEWACSLCTLINRPINKYCDACMSPRPEEPTKLEHSPLSRDLIRYPCNSFSKPLQEIKMNRKTAFGTTTLVLTNLSAKPDSASSPAINQAHTPETMRGLSTHSNWQWKSPSNGVSGMQFKGNEPYKREFPADHIQPNKRMKTMNGALSGGSMQRIGSLRVVTKEGENKGRQFYTCSLLRETQCNFFEWADLHFPMFLKLGPNNGRNFYTYSVEMGKQCNFFQWAENDPGISILPGC